MRRGIPVCMGTDAYTHDMLESLKVFLVIQRHNAAMPNVGWGEAMTMLFKNNYAMASKYFGRTFGKLAPGAAADVIVMDYPVFTPFSGDNIDGHIAVRHDGQELPYHDRERPGALQGPRVRGL